MPLGQPVDGFRLAHDRHGHPDRPAVVLLHGWPGDRGDHAAVAALLADDHDVLVPDLRGFGESDKHPADPTSAYSAAAHARSVAALIDELGRRDVVVGGYDVGSRVAQQLARDRPDLVAALVITPPVPGVGRRILDQRAVPEFWYQSFHQLDLIEHVLDGRPDAVRAYLRHFWSHWSGPEHVVDETRLTHLTEVYGQPGALTASINWYRAGGGAVARALAETVPDPADRLPTPTTVVWPEHDPLFPREWADRIGEFFVDATVQEVDRVGHFVPVEAPQTFADAVAAAHRTAAP